MKTCKGLACIVAALMLSTSPVVAAGYTDDPEVLIKDGTFFGQVRYRYEHVDDDGFNEDANAHTVRTNVGFKTGTYKGFQALIEAQIVQNLGDEDFNSTTNGNVGVFPTVADPDTEELNQLWFAWSGIPQTTAKVGRQKINLDNQRFVGTVDWRQNDQTFDSITLTNSSIEKLDLFYSYVGNVNRITGDDNPLGDLDSDVHLANASYEFAEWLTLTGYGYLLEFEELSNRSSQTYGLRATGGAPINEDLYFSYELEGAVQEDYENNTADYDEEYYHIAPAISGYGGTLTLGYEVLGGDGANSFQTPLATLHKFNGWADVFLNAPDEGLEDLYVKGVYKISNTDSAFDGTRLIGIYHDFESDEGSIDFGTELDLSIDKTFTLPDAGQPFKKVNALLKYADFDADSEGGLDDRQIIWFQLNVPF